LKPTSAHPRLKRNPEDKQPVSLSLRGFPAPRAPS